jgi:putative glycosyltransferase (TIGR04348 family)
VGRLSHLRKITGGMKIQLVTPAPLKLNNGNKITALRWTRLLKRLGHRVKITQTYDGATCDALIALHARRSAGSIERFHELHPNLPLIVVLTGTDLYRDIRSSKEAQRSLQLASRLVVLQKMALRELPGSLRAKTEVIYQSAEPVNGVRPKQTKTFDICVVAHLRDEKDPLRAAFAVRRLPPQSRIRVTHIGSALDARLGKIARREARRNPRYRWLGALSHSKTRALLARSHLVCITSKMEGSSNALSEALASGVPVVTSRIPGLIGTLGNNFNGFFPVGDTERLRRLLLRAETDRNFYRSLKRHCARLVRLVEPARESADWRSLLQKYA